MCRSAKGAWSVVNDVRNKNVHDSAGKIVSMYPNVGIATESINRIFPVFCRQLTCFNVPNCSS